MKKEYKSPEFEVFSVLLKNALAVSIDEETASGGVTHPTGDWEEDDGF